MRARVANPEQFVESVAWTPSGGPSARSTNTTAAFQGSDEVATLRQQLAETERRLQTEVAQARQQGFAQGVHQVRDEAANELRGALERVAASLTELAATKSRVRAGAEIELLKLSVAIARRIIHREIALDAEALNGLIYSALQKLGSRELLRVRVFPAGAEMLRSALARGGAPPSLEVIADGNLKSGDILFETSAGQLDASVETQLVEIQRGLTDRIAHRQHSHR